MTQPTMKELIAELKEAKTKVEAGGGEKRIEKQHESGKMTARERIDTLFDKGSFEESGAFRKHRQTAFGLGQTEIPADGVVTGAGMVDGRPVHVASQDFTAQGGSAGEIHCTKMSESMRSALANGTPVVLINDSGGARIQEGVDALAGYGRVFYSNVLLSGVVPQIAIIAGPCAGGASYSPALTDFIIQTRQANMFITGPDVIKAVTGETVTAEALGGPDAHMANSGVIHFIADDDKQAILIAQKLLSFLPANNTEEPPLLDEHLEVDRDESLNEVIPDDPKLAYDIHKIISSVVDAGDFLEVQAGWARNIVIGFARVTGRTVGIIASQPSVISGVLDIDASDKSARFVRFCNAFNVPLVTFVDVPGFLPGTAQEYGGIIRHGAKLLFAYSAATVPKVTVMLRKAYGGAYIAMCSRELGADRVFAWPSAEIAVMGAEGAANIVFRKEIAAADDPEAKRQEMVDAYRDAFNTPFVAAGRGYVDDIIEPAETRKYIARALEMLQDKRELRPTKKHGNIPL